MPVVAHEATRLADATGCYAAADETDPRSTSSAALESAIHVRQQYLAGATSHVTSMKLRLLAEGVPACCRPT